jgi:hypothetical protein
MLRGQVAFFRSSAVLTRGSYRNRAPSAHTITRHMSSIDAAIYADRFLADRAPTLSSLDVNKSFAQLRFVIPIVKTLIAA